MREAASSNCVFQSGKPYMSQLQQLQSVVTSEPHRKLGGPARASKHATVKPTKQNWIHNQTSADGLTHDCYAMLTHDCYAMGAQGEGGRYVPNA